MPRKKRRKPIKAFGNSIRFLRQEKFPNESIGSVANHIGISGPYDSNIETGVVPPPSEEVVSRMATVFGVDEGTLLMLAGYAHPLLMHPLKLYFPYPNKKRVWDTEVLNMIGIPGEIHSSEVEALIRGQSVAKAPSYYLRRIADALESRHDSLHDEDDYTVVAQLAVLALLGKLMSYNRTGWGVDKNDE